MCFLPNAGDILAWGFQEMFFERKCQFLKTKISVESGSWSDWE